MAYLVTFTTYGSHLHGDERGSVHSKLGDESDRRLDFNPPLNDFEARSLTHPPLLLHDDERRVALQAIQRTFASKQWWLGAVNVRTNHVHLVGAFPGTPERALTATKAAITASLRRNGLVVGASGAWTRHGSTRYLWSDAAVEAALRYVLEQQGHNLDGAFWPADV